MTTQNNAPSNPLARGGPLAAVQANPRGWTAVAVFLVLYGIAMMDRNILSLLVDPIRRDLNVTDFQISILQGAAFAIFYTLCGLPIGWAVDHFARRWIIFGGIVFWSLATTAGGVSRHYWQLLLSRCGVGMGEATLLPAAYSMLSDLFPKDRLAGASAVFSVGAMIGSAAAFVLGGVIVSAASAKATHHLPLFGEVWPWQLVLIIVGLPGLAAAFLVFLLREPVRRGRLEVSAVADKSQGATATSLRAFFGSQWRFYACHFLGFSLLNLVAQGFAAWAPAFLMRTYHWSVPKTAFVFGGVSITFGMAGMLASGHIVDLLFRRGARDAHLRYYLFAAPVLGLAAVIGMTAHNAAVSVACICVIMFIVPMIAVSNVALQITTPNQYRGQISALFLFAFNILGTSLGPSVVAGISDFALGGKGNIGLGLAITFAIFTPIATAMFWLGLKPMRRAIDAAEAWSTT